MQSIIHRANGKRKWSEKMVEAIRCEKPTYTHGSIKKWDCKQSVWKLRRKQQKEQGKKLDEEEGAGAAKQKKKTATDKQMRKNCKSWNFSNHEVQYVFFFGKVNENPMMYINFWAPSCATHMRTKKMLSGTRRTRRKSTNNTTSVK